MTYKTTHGLMAMTHVTRTTRRPPPKSEIIEHTKNLIGFWDPKLFSDPKLFLELKFQNSFRNS